MLERNNKSYLSLIYQLLIQSLHEEIPCSSEKIFHLLNEYASETKRVELNVKLIMESLAQLKSELNQEQRLLSD